MRQDGAMAGHDLHARLTEDPRTADVGGDRHVMSMLARDVGRLLALLGPAEPAVWATMSQGPVHPPPSGQGRWASWTSNAEMWLVVRTPTRLLLLPTLTGKGTVATIDGPWTTDWGISDLVQTKVTLTGAGGGRGSHSLQIPSADLVHLAWETHFDTVLPDPAPPATSSCTGPSPDAGPVPPDIGSLPSEPPRTTLENQPRSSGDGTAVPSLGGWVWNRPIATWQAAEILAAAHMRHLGFADVRLSGSGVDQGIDVIAAGAAAQVKLHARSAGGPEIQQLYGAAHGLPDRLFYAMGFTPAAVRAAEITGVALFAYETTAGAVTPANDAARELSPARPGGDEREPFGALTLDGRRTRALRWVSQVQDATKAPLSNRKRASYRQLEQRKQALALVVQACALIEAASRSDTNKKRRAKRLLRDAEKLLRTAAALVKARLR